VSFAYLPLYTGDYLRDTQHLSCSEHGIYLKLLMHCWDQKGPAPLDERKLCGIVNARSSDEIEALRRVLGEFFVRMEDGHYNHRMQREVERCEVISGVRSEAGKKGYQAKAKQLPNKSRTLAKQVPLTPSPSLSLNHTNTTNTTRGSARGDGFAIFWQAYPRKIAKVTAEKAFSKLAPSVDLLDEIVAAIERQKACPQWTKDGGQFIPHPASWLNAARWQDEADTVASAFGGAV